MARSNGPSRRGAVLAGLAVVVSGLLAPAAPAPAAPEAAAPPAARVEGPLPGTVPGDPQAPDVEGTYPWLATGVDLELGRASCRERVLCVV